MVPDDLVGGLLGFSLGEALRRVYYGRKTDRALEGADVKVRVKAHPASAPSWRYWRGALVQRGDNVTFRPLLRRWRTIDLTGITALDGATRRSAAQGTRGVVTLLNVPRVDHLAGSPEAAKVAKLILRPRRDRPAST